MATNQQFDSGPLNVVASDPASPHSGDPVLVGQLTGVALTDKGKGSNISTETTVDFRPNVWNLSVKGVDGGGNSAVAVGDKIYYVSGDTPVLSKKNTGVFFGYALDAVSSGATTTIRVKKTAG